MIVKLQDKKLPKRNKDKGSVLERYYKSFLHAIDGIIYAAKYEHNIIIIICATVLVVVLSFIFKINTYEWLFVILICAGYATKFNSSSSPNNKYVTEVGEKVYKGQFLTPVENFNVVSSKYGARIHPISRKTEFSYRN